MYPALEPFAVQQVAVGRRHALHVEQSGNARGFPAIFLHGGPGSQARALHRRFFDPQFYRIVLFDQRGCGLSRPLGCTEENTTHDLIGDMEALRRRFALERVVLFGGSWGATLALAYAVAYPQHVAGMVLRGPFLGSRAEIERYVAGMGESGDVLARYHEWVNQPDEAAARAAAQRWVGYEDAVMRLGTTERGSEQDAASALGRARVQLHYLVHECFLAPGALLCGLAHLPRMPLVIVQGARDHVCPPGAAREIAGRLPWAELRLVEAGGHLATQPAMAEALCRATDDLRSRL